MKVRCETKLISVEGRRLTFSPVALDEKEKLETCLHERFVIDNEKFMKKVSNK